MWDIEEYRDIDLTEQKLKNTQQPFFEKSDCFKTSSDLWSQRCNCCKESHYKEYEILKLNGVRK